MAIVNTQIPFVLPQTELVKQLPLESNFVTWFVYLEHESVTTDRIYPTVSMTEANLRDGNLTKHLPLLLKICVVVLKFDLSLEILPQVHR